MIDNSGWKEVPRAAVPKGANKLSMAWSMKIKANDKRRARLNARGSEEKAGVYYKPDNIAAPVVDSNFYRKVRSNVEILDFRHAFLKG